MTLRGLRDVHFEHSIAFRNDVISWGELGSDWRLVYAVNFSTRYVECVVLYAVGGLFQICGQQLFRI